MCYVSCTIVLKLACLVISWKQNLQTIKSFSGCNITQLLVVYMGCSKTRWATQRKKVYTELKCAEIVHINKRIHLAQESVHTSFCLTLLPSVMKKKLKNCHSVKQIFSYNFHLFLPCLEIFVTVYPIMLQYNNSWCEWSLRIRQESDLY